MKPYTVDQKKWEQFPWQAQMQNIAAELARVTSAQLHGQDAGWISQGFERALAMIDASIDDPQWKQKRFLFQLRDAVASLYAQPTDPAISRFIMNQLLERTQ